MKKSQSVKNFERNVRIIIEGVVQERRWAKFQGISFENVLMHTVKQSLQVIKMIAIEKAHDNQHNLDFYRILQHAILHDLPEGDPSYKDINYHDKRKDEETKRKCREKEDEILDSIKDRLVGGKYKDHIPPFLDLDPNTSQNDKMFWEAAEHISHMYFMLEEIQLDTVSKSQQKKFYHDIVTEHIEWLGENAWHFVSVREIVENEILPKCKEIEEED